MEPNIILNILSLYYKWSDKFYTKTHTCKMEIPKNIKRKNEIKNEIYYKLLYGKATLRLLGPWPKLLSIK